MVFDDCIYVLVVTLLICHFYPDTLEVIGFHWSKEVVAGRSVSRATFPQEQTMEGSTLPPPLLSLLFSDCDTELHIPSLYQVCLNALVVSLFLSPLQWPHRSLSLVNAEQYKCMQKFICSFAYNVIKSSSSCTHSSILPVDSCIKVWCV